MPRFTGKNAALYLSTDGGSTWAWIPDVYEIVLETPLVIFTARIKGDVIARRVPSHLGEATLAVRRFVTGLSQLAARAILANNSFNGSLVFAEGQRLSWAIVGADPAFPTAGDPAGFTGNANIKAQGTGYVERGRYGFPRDRIEDDFTIAVDTIQSMV